MHPSERPTRAWPLSPSQRLWLYATLEAELGAIAKAKDRDIEVADLLAAGCDHTPRLTAAWARRAGIEPAELYQALAARGGFCDCEVLLNAARDDDRELDAVLVAGTIEAGIVADCVDQLLLEGEPPSLPWLGASPSEDKKSHGALLVGADGERVSPQLVDSLTIGEMLRLLSSVELDHAVARVLLVYPDADGATEIVDVGGEHTRFRTLPPDADPADEPELSSTARADLEALRRAIPARDPVTASGTIDWPPAAAGPLLLARAGGSWLTVEVGAGASPRGIGLETDALATTPTMDRIAWLSTYRARTDLLVEDRGCPVRTRLATARFGRSLGFSADGAFLFAVDAGEVVRYELATGARQTLCPGTEVRTAPRGAMLAITADDELSIWSTDGRLVLPPRAGHSPVWSPQGDKLGYLGRVDGEGWQIFVLDVRRDRAWRVSPPCREACWPSFTDGGAALVLWGSTARHETPVGGGRIRVEDDEVLWHVPADGSAEVRVIWSAARGYQRILAPVAHPQLPLVAFRTQDAPQVGRRLVLARTTGEEQPRTFLEQDARAVAWLDR